jgi:hypothetical protein
VRENQEVQQCGKYRCGDGLETDFPEAQVFFVEKGRKPGKRAELGARTTDARINWRGDPL